MDAGVPPCPTVNVGRKLKHVGKHRTCASGMKIWWRQVKNPARLRHWAPEGKGSRCGWRVKKESPVEAVPAAGLSHVLEECVWILSPLKGQLCCHWLQVSPSRFALEFWGWDHEHHIFQIFCQSAVLSSASKRPDCKWGGEWARVLPSSLSLILSGGNQRQQEALAAALGWNR